MNDSAAIDHDRAAAGIGTAAADADSVGLDPTSEHTSPGIFEAGLYYLAADLRILAAQAPAHKREALFAIEGLVSALADA